MVSYGSNQLTPVLDHAEILCYGCRQQLVQHIVDAPDLSVQSFHVVANLIRCQKVIGDAVVDNKLSSVLASTASPIRDFVTKVIEPTSNPVDLSDRKSYFTMLVLKDCDFDLEKVEAKIRELYPKKGASYKKLMEPYRSMMSQMRGERADEFYQTLLSKLA